MTEETPKGYEYKIKPGEYFGCGYGRHVNGEGSPVECTRPEGCFRKRLEDGLCGIWLGEKAKSKP